MYVMFNEKLKKSPSPEGSAPRPPILQAAGD